VCTEACTTCIFSGATTLSRTLSPSHHHTRRWNIIVEPGPWGIPHTCITFCECVGMLALTAAFHRMVNVNRSNNEDDPNLKFRGKVWALIDQVHGIQAPSILVIMYQTDSLSTLPASVPVLWAIMAEQRLHLSSSICYISSRSLVTCPIFGLYVLSASIIQKVIGTITWQVRLLETKILFPKKIYIYNNEGYNSFGFLFMKISSPTCLCIMQLYFKKL
jgi:hypothetical protein